jgi:hypothetical protein
MEAYRRIAVAQTVAEIEKITIELKQAYGDDLPPATQRLIDLAELRVLASNLRIRSVAVRGQDVLLRGKPADLAPVALLLQDGGVSHVTLLPPRTGEDLGEVYFRPPPNWMKPEELLGVLRRRLRVADQSLAHAP